MRHLTLVVLFVSALLASMPAAAAGPADWAGRSPAASVSRATDPAGAEGLEALFSPGNEPQNKVCIYVCDVWDYTSMKRGKGPDCTAANNDLASQVGSEASSSSGSVCSGSALGYCGFNLYVTVSCHWDFVIGQYVTDGYGGIKCKDWC